MEILTLMTPLQERIDNFLTLNPNAEYIPLHPDDYNSLYSEDNQVVVNLPVKVLGKIGHDVFAAKDVWGEQVYEMLHGESKRKVAAMEL